MHESLRAYMCKGQSYEFHIKKYYKDHIEYTTKVYAMQGKVDKLISKNLRFMNDGKITLP
jgi:hypothetical protein